MTERIRRMGVVLGFLFCVLLLMVTKLQLVDAEKNQNHPQNTRDLARDFGRDRGAIQTADGVVLARSEPSDDQYRLQRTYPEGALFAPVTGYLSFTYVSDGAERAFNDQLTGGTASAGDRSLKDLFQEDASSRDVTLTIRADVQKAAAAALGNRKGAVVALDPSNGDVLALVSFPTFDPNPLAGHTQADVTRAWDGFNADPNKPLLPRAYRESYPPGSTFKVVTAGAALDRQRELAEKDYPRLKQLDLPRTTKDLPNFGGGTCGGRIGDLLRVSCNTGFAQMGIDLGGQNLTAEAQAFGFGERPPLDLPAPARSRFPAVERFKGNDLGEPGLAFSAIGQQNVSATPLQMALVAAAVANNGVIMKPHVLAKVTDPKGAVTDTYAPSAWRTATSPETAAALKAMMVDVAARGTATRAQIPGATVGGKTGTAQTQGDNAHAWIITFAPAEAPRVAVAVIVESQPGLGDVTGGRIAAPIAAEVMKVALGL